jgi:hypothetical protein
MHRSRLFSTVSSRGGRMPAAEILWRAGEHLFTGGQCNPQQQALLHTILLVLFVSLVLAIPLCFCLGCGCGAGAGLLAGSKSARLAAARLAGLAAGWADTGGAAIGAPGLGPAGLARLGRYRAD